MASEITGITAFENLFKYFEQTEVEAVVLGCTHFPYIKEELEKITKLSIIDVGIFMIESLSSNLYKKFFQFSKNIARKYQAW